MSVETEKSVKIMVSMSPAVYEQLIYLSNKLQSSKSKIVQMSIIFMKSSWNETLANRWGKKNEDPGDEVREAQSAVD